MSDRPDKQDAAVAGTFPASDPPATMGTEEGARAVPPERIMKTPHAAPYDAVALRRRFPTQEAAKLALEAMVRDGPVDRASAQLSAIGREIELTLNVPEDDCHRIRALLAHA